MQKMKATVFHGPNNIRLEEVPRPKRRRRRSGNSDHANHDLRD